MKRFVRFLFAWFVWERKPQPAPDETVSAALRDSHQRKIEGFNRALAAATSLRELLRKQISDTSTRQAALQGNLNQALAKADEQRGAQLALELQNASAEARDLAQRLDEAARNAVDLMTLRDEAIARAREELKEVADLAQRASASQAFSPKRD